MTRNDYLMPVADGRYALSPLHDFSAIVTMPPYAPFLDKTIAHAVVSGIRLNTMMPTSGSLDDLLGRLGEKTRAAGKTLYLDLKGRQLRVKTFGVPPFTEIELTHAISVRTPVTAYFSNGDEHATVLRVDGNRLIMQEGPRRVVGPGESVNIPDASLEVDGTFTEKDLAYIDAAKRVGLHDYMLSFVETRSDVDALRQLDPCARIIAKIESSKGLSYARDNDDPSVRLMGARGDLYIELPMPHDVIPAMSSIVRKDPTAIAASRILSSLSKSTEPSCADLSDVDSLLRMGYRTLMLGDEICQKEESCLSALNVLKAMKDSYRRDA